MNIMRNSFTVNFAGLTIGIETISPSACVLCRDYLVDGSEDFNVKICQADVDKEYEDSGEIKPSKLRAEITAVYRKIVEGGIDYDVFLMHGAVIAVDDAAILFTAPSGTGKTTHIKLWLQNISDAVVVNGDKPLLRLINDQIVACGTPWCGNENMNSNIIKPLKAIVIMKRSEDNYIEPVSFQEAYPFLLQQTYLPKDPEKAKKVLSLLLKLNKRVSFYRFYFNNYKCDCFNTAYRALFN